MELEKLKWMDYSGSPILFLPEQLQREWFGFYAEVPDAFDGIPDMEIDGQAYLIEDTFDFDNPRTDYDCICAVNDDVYTYDLASGKALVVSSFYDALTWLDDKQMLVNGRLDELREAVLMKLKWESLVEWQMPSEKVWIMNSCLCLQSKDLEDGDFMIIELKPGKYRIERANYEEEYCAILYRFTRIE